RLKECKKVNFQSNLKYAEDTDFLEKYLPNRKYIIQDEILYYYSEFESVSKYKILKTNIYGIILFSKSFNETPLKTTKNIIKNLLKISVKIILYPFVDANFYLNKRGENVTDQQKNEFKEIIRIIS